MSTYWSLLAALSMLLLTYPTQQSPAQVQPYSSDILRLAKAAQIKAYMNSDTDRCDNFYKYACGQWKRLHVANASHTETSYMEQLSDLYVRKSADMLQSSRELDTTIDRMLKNFFESCHNESALQQLGLEPIIKATGLKGGWPNIVSQTWYEYEYDWLEVIGELRRKYGVDILIGLDIVPDYEEGDLHRIKLGAPHLTLGSKDAYLADDFDDEREDYLESIEEKLRHHFPNMGKRWAQEIAAQVLDLEQQLAKGLPDNKELTLPQTTRQRFTSELNAAYGNFIDLNHYLHLVFNETIYSQIYETPEDYLANLVEVLKQTSKYTLANYTMWRMLEHFDFAGEINEKHNDKWCIHQVIKYFPEQLESMFHRNYNNMQMINELQSVFTDVKKTFHEELQSSPQLNWITLNIRQKSILKLEAMKLKIMVHDDHELAEQLRSLVIHPGRYFDNLINIFTWQTPLQLAKLIQKPESVEIPSKLPCYSHKSNSINIPITFMQTRFFWDPEYPHALKYATLGFLLAHEMLHAFDSVGRRYDPHGNQRGWWDSISEYTYDERSVCFAKQLSYAYDGTDYSNADALLETIVDSGGVGVAYRTYQKWWDNLADKQDILQKETLPLLDLTPRQLFFVSFAQLWCADYHNDAKASVTVPEPVRVNTALAHFEEFAREMKCKAGSKMNLPKKCVIF